MLLADMYSKPRSNTPFPSPLPYSRTVDFARYVIFRFDNGNQENKGEITLVRTVTEESRELPVVAEPDVVVLGGGPAGYAAATASARIGADTLLVERYGCLGGMATGAHVIYMDQMSDGEKQVVFGIMQDVVEKSILLGGCQWREERLNPYIDAEIHKYVAQELVETSGSRMLLHTWATNTIMEGNNIEAVITESKSGRQAILPKVVIDATGDADVAAFSGAEYALGKMPITVMSRVGGVDIERANRFRNENPEKYDALNERLFQMKVFVRPPPEQMIGTGWSPTTRENVVYCHWATFLDRDATKAEDLTYCEIEGRKRIMTVLNYYIKNIPGFEKAYLLDVCPQIGTRLSRIVTGEYTLTINDLNDQRRFYDNIGTQPYRTKRMSYHIPYRCLVPKNVDNLLVAGRCISTDIATQVHTRIIPQCVSTGQAAGTAAALSVKHAMRPRDLIDVEEISLVQDALVKQRVNLEPRLG